MLPAGSVARTWNVCSAVGEVGVRARQAPQSPSSSRHSNAAGSSAPNSNVADVSLVGSSGPLSMVVVGATLSTVHA